MYFLEMQGAFNGKNGGQYLPQPQKCVLLSDSETQQIKQ